ncbi:hypothetical protein QBC38DRAFT_448900 [Podospora fimiseda]|uniref:Uncharacterized protein n=1 Tax=Podospora fimiseda TaxID=252190 RepID=A0AAN6YPF3_9PEZI|nr:hypothetical protein QBC38DRAFT_448900 [Podospora fimiseda]
MRYLTDLTVYVSTVTILIFHPFPYITSTTNPHPPFPHFLHPKQTLTNNFFVNKIDYVAWLPIPTQVVHLVDSLVGHDDVPHGVIWAEARAKRNAALDGSLERAFYDEIKKNVEGRISEALFVGVILAVMAHFEVLYFVKG